MTTIAPIPGGCQIPGSPPFRADRRKVGASADEWAILEAAARAAGRTLSRWMRETLLRAAGSPPPEEERELHRSAIAALVQHRNAAENEVRAWREAAAQIGLGDYAEPGDLLAWAEGRK
jgi:hypothetical protein